MKTRTLFLALIVFGMSAFSSAASNSLYKNGKTDYVMVLSPQASVSEKTAAKELQSYLLQIGGVAIPIIGMDEVSDKVLDRSVRKGTRIHIGWSDEVSSALGAAKPETTDESFIIAAKGRGIFIFGGALRGTMYGVFTFLEENFGVRWFTPECTVVPEKSEWSFEDFQQSYAPALKYRFVQYHNAMRSPSWLAHNKDNAVWTAEDNEYGGLSGYWSAHTFGRFVPAETYFESHPEYFSVHDGKRIPNGQLCLTNPAVMQLCIDGMKKAIAQNPLYWVYSLSQNDNMLPCECDECKALENRYGGHSGAMLWFVNQVADAIKQTYPDKYIGTFAYQYTRHAPKDMVPRDNVVIRLCSIECDFSHPIASTEFNRPFLEDLKDWSAIAPHLFIWDYVVNFNQYIAPYPNFQSLSDNIRLFRDHNAMGVMEEANYQSDGGEFSEMKAWVLAKLLWNPELDTEALVDEFISGYYEAAAPKVKEYFNLCKSLVKDDTIMGFAFDEFHPMYTEDFISKSTVLIADARKAISGNEELERRIDRVAAQILYLKVLRDKEGSAKDGSRDELLRIIDRERMRAREWASNEDFIKSIM